MTELGTRIERGYLHMTLNIDMNGDEPPSLNQFVDAVASLDELISATFTPMLTDVDDRYRYRLDNEVVMVRYASPLEVVITFGGQMGLLGGGFVLAMRLGHQLMALIDRTHRMQRDKYVYDAQKAAAQVLTEHMIGEGGVAHETGRDPRAKLTPALEKKKAKSRAEKAALALSILESVDFREE